VTYVFLFKIKSCGPHYTWGTILLKKWWRIIFGGLVFEGIGDHGFQMGGVPRIHYVIHSNEGLSPQME
jgi:hypothetical protein